MLPHLHIIGHTLCPYVQRVVILLHELGLPYARTNIELDAKPGWMLDLSPTGKVPILVVDHDRVLFESGVILDYLAALTQRPLLPDDPLDRATQRAWAAYGDQILAVATNIIYHTKTAKAQKQAFAQMAEMLSILEAQLHHAPYFSGADIQLIDVVFAPVFRLIKVLGHLASIDLFADCPNLIVWRDALQARASVKGAVPQPFHVLMRQFIAQKSSFAAIQLAV